MTRLIHYIYFFAVVIVTIDADDFNVTINTQPLSLPSVTVSWYPSVDNKVTTTVFYKQVGSPTYVQKTLPQSNKLTLSDLDFNVEYNVFVQTLMSSGNKKNSTMKTFRTRRAPKALVESDKRMSVTMLRQRNVMFYRIYVQEIINANDGLEDLSPTTTLQLDFTDNTDSDIYLTYHGDQFPERTKNLVIGDNTKTSYKNQEITNRALKPDTRYSFFQRNFFNETSFTSNDWMDILTTKKSRNGPGGEPVEVDDDEIDDTDIAIITVAVAIGVVAIIFILMCICHYKFSMKYAPKAKPKRNQDTTQRMLSHPSIPVTETDFYDHVSQMKFHNFKGFYDEFALLRKTDMKISAEFRKPINVEKNRYLNKPLGNLSRVTLEGNEPYIYANYIPGTDSDKDYIFTQNPLPETVKDFWAMVAQKDVHNIVMIGEFTEKSEQICAKYFPDLDDEDFETPAGKVTLFQIHSTADYHIRTLNFTTPNQETRIIKHFQFISWPHVRLVPEIVTPFLSFINVIERSRKTQGLNGPIIVHGSTTADRAGIYMCIDSQIRRIEDQTDVNVFNQVSDLKERIFDGIKTLDEYIFIHDGILEFILKRKIKNIPVQKLPEYVENVSKAADSNPFTLEYTFLTSLSSTLKMDAGIQVYNKDKNRYQNIKPYDTNRVKLSKIPNKDGSDYINASWIDTYLRKKAFIAAQAPLVETLADFWRMISENESWVIIMLGQEIENGQLKADRFWPIEGNIMAFGDLTVKLLCVQQGNIPDVIIRQIEMLNSKTGTSKLVQFYQYITWPSHEGISSESIHSLVRLVHLSDTWELKLKAKTVTIVTSSGIGRSGVLIALRSLQEESEVEGSVNIFRTVQRLRQQRAALVQTKEEYILIYTSAMEISQNVRRRSILNESFSDLTAPGVDIIPNGFSISRNGSIVGKLQSTPSVSEASQF